MIFEEEIRHLSFAGKHIALTFSTGFLINDKYSDQAVYSIATTGGRSCFVAKKWFLACKTNDNAKFPDIRQVCSLPELRFDC